MDYSLVLQFRGDCLEDFGEMVDLEAALIAHLGLSAEVDGHHMGAGERNILITTSAPAETFCQIKPILDQMNCLSKTTVAYKVIGFDDYTVLWPKGSEKKFKMFDD